MSYPQTDPLSNSEPPLEPGFRSQVQLGLPEVLQMCCVGRRSGQITFRSGESYGFVFIQHGRVLHAMCGTLEGEEAIYLMLTWPGGGYSLNEDILPHKKSIALSWEQLLFEGAGRADGRVDRSEELNPVVTTLEPVSSSRMQESQPKLTITRPDTAPLVYELVQEFTHVGRAPGNEISLPYPSVSNRHCMFLLSGSDIVLRDLNSSNGTMVNGQTINEVILLPGDQIDIGVVRVKFEAGIKRPKLLPPAPTVATGKKGSILPVRVNESAMADLTRGTVRLPDAKTPPRAARSDSAFVKGESAISYESISTPAPAKGSGFLWLLWVVGGAAILGGGYYFINHGH